MRILDLGCGEGEPPILAGITSADQVIGMDLDKRSLNAARRRYPQRWFLCGRSEHLPFAGQKFDRVVSGVALPYMDIPRTLRESYRILKPGGTVFFSVHPLRFTLGELRRSFPKPVASAFRLYVMLSGFYFHLTGKTFPRESFQTKRGLRIALRREGFTDIVFDRPNHRLIVRASKPRAT